MNQASTLSAINRLPSRTPTGESNHLGTARSHSELLRDAIVSRLEQEQLTIERFYFASSRLQLAELAPAIERLERKGKLSNLLHDLVEFGLQSTERRRLLTESAPTFMALISTSGKIRMTNELLKLKHKPTKRAIGYAVVRSCVDREQLFSVVSPQRALKLLSLRYAPLKDIVGKVETLRALNDLRVPTQSPRRRKPANNAAERREARDHVQTILEVAQTGLRRLETLSNYKRKSPDAESASNARHSAPSAFIDAHVTLSAVARQAEKLLTGPRPSLSRLKTFIDVAGARLNLECSEAIRLSQSHTVHAKNGWTASRIEKLTTALSLIPEGHRLMSPKLRGFHLTKMRNLGERRPSGRVALSVTHISQHNRKDEFGGWDHLTGITVHEVAHGIQMSSSEPFVLHDPTTGDILTPSSPLFHLPSFAALSGWKFVAHLQKGEFFARDSVTLNNKLFPLHRPVFIPSGTPLPGRTDTEPGTWAILRSSYPVDTFVYRHDITAEFARCKTACDDPFEDWAESFSDYLLAPDQLLAMAAKKFYYMETHFRVYLRSKDYQRLLVMHEALKNDQATSGAS